jgi:hypothetical protein
MIDNGTPIPSGTQELRQSIRVACEGKVESIAVTSTTDQLAVYITGAEYPVWPTGTI